MNGKSNKALVKIAFSLIVLFPVILFFILYFGFVKIFYFIPSENIKLAYDILELILSVTYGFFFPVLFPAFANSHKGEEIYERNLKNIRAIKTAFFLALLVLIMSVLFFLIFLNHTDEENIAILFFNLISLLIYIFIVWRINLYSIFDDSIKEKKKIDLLFI